MNATALRSLVSLSLASLAVASALASLTAACGPADDGDGPGTGETCSASILPGDLVITEVMANPEGDDDGNEYFEIFNVTGTAIDLGGLMLEKSSVDGTGLKQHAISDLSIPSRQYLALGGVVPEFRADYIAYGYSDDLGSMTNSGGILRLVCGDVVVDEMVYGEAASGRSQGLDGNIEPTAEANDDLNNFCDATTEFATDAFGSPGVKNEPCSIVEQTTCLDNGGERDVNQPAVGDLVITEIMPNPDAVADEVGEWFEITATKTVDLNGLVAGKDPADPKVNVLADVCLTIEPGDTVLFARSADPLVNGGLPAPDQTFSFGLSNSNSTLFVGVGDVIVDQVAWTSSPTGRSLSLDPGATDATANDDPENFCDGQSEYGAGDKGTPRALNTPCNTNGLCNDGGTLRPVVSPEAADVTITEFMANPAAVSDTVGEYFEVHFAKSVDLNGLQWGKEADPELVVTRTFDAIDCETVPADTYVVFARNTDPGTNGGLPSNFIYESGLSLSQTAGGTFHIFVAFDGVVLDLIEYLGSDTSAGVSRQIDLDGQVCNSTLPYGAGDLGTPGLANGDCP